MLETPFAASINSVSDIVLNPEPSASNPGTKKPLPGDGELQNNFHFISKGETEQNDNGITCYDFVFSVFFDLS